MSRGALVARRIWIDAERSIPRAELVWNDAGRIVALRRLTAKAARGRLREVALFPSLVDAHCHLQLPPLGDDAPRQFLPWVRAVMTARAALRPAALVAGTKARTKALLREGVATFGEIDATGDSPKALEGLGATGRVYQELTGFHLEPREARRRMAERRVAPPVGWGGGWSPHAPYSVSPSLFAAAARSRRPLAIHCAELPEEQEFLRRGTGPFRDLLQSLGRLPHGFRPPGVGAVAHLERLGVLRPGVHLVHCQELERGDLARLVRHRTPVVVCPGTMAWFGRTPPPVHRWLAAGLQVGIGTDSAASNAGWSLRAELAQLGAWLPQLEDRQLLAIATRHGAAALHLPHSGRLCRGGRADFVAMAAAAEEEHAPLRALVRNTENPVEVCLGGRRIAGVGRP
ncbi:MAG: hypothetical protein RL398_687 [Planctomycetota bacterium]